MKRKDPLDDRFIRDAVQFIPTPIPPQLNKRVADMLTGRRRSKRPSFHRRWRLGIALAASVLFGVLVLTGPFLRDHGEPTATPGRSITTRIDIPGKKITIVWMQREGFSLPLIQGVKP